MKTAIIAALILLTARFSRSSERMVPMWILSRGPATPVPTSRRFPVLATLCCRSRAAVSASARKVRFLLGTWI